MSSNRPFKLFLAWSLATSLLDLACAKDHAASRTHLRGLQADGCDAGKDSVLCRVFVFDTMYVALQEEGNVKSVEQVRCIPIVEDIESDYDIAIDLSLDLYEEHRAAITEGYLLASICDAKFEDDTLVMGNQSHIRLVNESRYNPLRERHLQIKSEYTVAVIRVSTSDATPNESRDQIEKTLFGAGGTNFQTQFDACSFGNLKWVSNGVLDVTIPNSVTEFVGDAASGDLISAVQKHMHSNMGYSQGVSAIADKVIMCLPPGTGDWAAAAGVGHWRTQMNNGWCLSLSANMHELGHTLGLLHANKNGEKYKDMTGYMSSSYRSSSFPIKCFNSYNSYHLGFYSDRHLDLDPLSQGDRLVDLAASVHANKAGGNESVVVNLADKYFLQYNVAEGFNFQTEEKKNNVVVTEKSSTGTDSLAGLGLGDLYKISNFMESGKTLHIQACETREGQQNGVQVMRVSIAFDKSLCENSTGSVAGTSTGDAACFSGKNTVEVLGNRELTLMGDLQIGDFVRTSDGKFSRVYSFSHIEPETYASYLQIDAQDLDTPLEISPDHMLFVGRMPVRARDVKVGDMLGENMVSAIKTVQRLGLYAPVTTNGNIVVSGVVSSCFVALLDIPASIQHAASQAVHSPLRLACTSNFEICQNEGYTAGRSNFVWNIIRFVRALQEFPIVVQLASVVVASPFMVAAYVIEQVILAPLFFSALFLCSHFLLQKNGKSKCKTL